MHNFLGYEVEHSSDTLRVLENNDNERFPMDKKDKWVGALERKGI